MSVPNKNSAYASTIPSKYYITFAVFYDMNNVLAFKTVML